MTRQMKIAVSIIALLLGTSTLSAQSTPDARATYRKLREEVQRTYKAKDYPALIEANKKVIDFTHGSSRWMLNLAGCYALAGRKEDAFRTLQRVADMKIDATDALKDDDFESLRKERGWPSIVQSFAKNSEPVGFNRTEAKLDDAGLLTEDIAWSKSSRTFFLTSIRQKKILRIDPHSEVTEFADFSKDPGWPLFAIVADETRGALWVTAAAMPNFELAPKADWGRTALLEIDIASGKLRHRYDLPDDGTPHVLGDAALRANGDLIISDGLSGAIYNFHSGDFSRIDQGEFLSPQTPAISADGTIIVPDYIRGPARIVPDSSNPVTWIANPSNALTGIDGLYFAPDSPREEPVLYAIQNGTSPHRIVAIHLDQKLRAVKSVDVLLSNSPGLGEPSHGLFTKDHTFFFIANSGWDQLEDNGKVKADVTPTAPEIRELHNSATERPTLRRNRP
jgi:hypothetical protein